MFVLQSKTSKFQVACYFCMEYGVVSGKNSAPYDHMCVVHVRILFCSIFFEFNRKFIYLQLIEDDNDYDNFQYSLK